MKQRYQNMRILLLFLVANGISAWRSIRFSTALHATQPWGQGLSQEELMYKDECIVVSPNDEILGHTSKFTAHRFDDPAYPQGRLHRAFSVFLFNNEGKLLLQQRAADKITFPSVWTNTCCSHPLYGYSPSEVDDDEAIATGNVNGIKFAAIRKLQVERSFTQQCSVCVFLSNYLYPHTYFTLTFTLAGLSLIIQHELGIDCAVSGITLDSFKYLGRIHYCSADPDTAISRRVSVSITFICINF